MMGSEAQKVPDEVYGRIGLRKLKRMLRRQARKPSGDWCALGKVWLDIPERGLLAAHSIQLVVLEVEAPKADSTDWILRGLVCHATPLAWRVGDRGASYEIRYDSEEQVGTQESWRAFPGATVGDMHDLVSRLVR